MLWLEYSSRSSPSSIAGMQGRGGNAPARGGRRNAGRHAGRHGGGRQQGSGLRTRWWMAVQCSISNCIFTQEGHLPMHPDGWEMWGELCRFHLIKTLEFGRHVPRTRTSIDVHPRP